MAKAQLNCRMKPKFILWFAIEYLYITAKDMIRIWCKLSQDREWDAIQENK